ncbi:MAG TPA: hypothetical protein VF228_19180 [Iamia sp.]
MPRPADIPFDHAAAAVAVDALERAIAVLADASAVRVEAAATASEQFRGVYAEDFVRRGIELGQASGDARSSVAAVRSAIASGAEAARLAQAARGLEQQAWDTAHADPPPVGVR